MASRHFFFYTLSTDCNMIWASTYESRLRKLVILQNRAIRIIAGIRNGRDGQITW